MKKHEACLVYDFWDIFNNIRVPISKPKACAVRRNFGQNLVYLRQKANLTQEQLAEKVEISTRHLQAIEAGDYWPTLPTLRKMRLALKVDWATLCEE
jgi:DNA-binding XRE family transcriptional regulator